jgi:hypothetical protein
MSRVPNDKLEQVAAMLGANDAKVVDELRQHKKVVGYWAGHDSNDDERTLFACALDLRDRLPMYEEMYKLLGEDPPLCIDATLQALEDLIPVLAQWVEEPQHHRPVDLRLRLCALVCLRIWKKVHRKAQPDSRKLWAACEAYWVACGHPYDPSCDLKKWSRHLHFCLHNPLKLS